LYPIFLFLFLFQFNLWVKNTPYLKACYGYFPVPDISVKIAEDKDFTISATSPYKIKDKSKEKIFHYPVKIRPLPAGIDVEGSIWQKQITVEPMDGSFCEVNKRRYRGIILVKKSKDKLEIINTLSLEEYLYGLIKLEISPEWPLPTLCAQAIVARTYAIRKLWEDSSILTNLAQHQMYGGVEAEDARGRIAVDLTRGEILTYKGRPINSVYHACSGGYITSSKEVWGEDYPYLKAHKDPFSIHSPYDRWQVKILKSELEKILQRAGLRVRGLKSLKILKKDTSGRCKVLLISFKNGHQFISGNKLREILGFNFLRSTLFEINNKKDELIFEGKGWGHGVGMSQWGAARMGELGYSTEEILYFYYPGTGIKKIY